jgi:hypothetical protein
MTTLDLVIKSDLAELGEDSRREPIALDDALRTTNMYRDDRPGVEARRDALADERRRELVMMPLTLSHVFAHRVGRAAAGVAGMVCTAVLLAMLADPLLMHAAAWFVPGLNVGMLVALTAIAILGVYIVATLIAEAWFARRMRAAIAKGEDPYRDIDTLARGPVEIAQQAVRRVDGVSLALFLAGSSVVALGFGYVVAIVGALHEFPHAWQLAGIDRALALSKNVDVLMLAMMGAGFVAYLVGRGCQRGETSAIVRILGHWAALAVSLVVGFATATVGFNTLYTIRLRRELPPSDVRFLLGIAAMVAIVGVAAWALLWWRRREAARIGE